MSSNVTGRRLGHRRTRYLWAGPFHTTVSARGGRSAFLIRTRALFVTGGKMRTTFDDTERWPDIAWRYVSAGRSKHGILAGPLNDDPAAAAVCGVSPAFIDGNWLGDGSPAEQQRLDELTHCADCVRILEHGDDRED